MADTPSQPIHVDQGEVLYGLHPVRAALTTLSRDQYHTLFALQGDDDARAIAAAARRQDMVVQEVSKQDLNILTGDRPHQVRGSAGGVAVSPPGGLAVDAVVDLAPAPVPC